MTVYEPGGACLTKTQHDQQVFMKQLQERRSTPPVAAAAGNNTVGKATPVAPEAVQPVSDTASSARLLDIRA